MCKQLSNATMDYYQRQPFSDAAGDSLRFLVKQLESAGKLTTADVFDLDSAIGAALAEVEAHALSVGLMLGRNPERLLWADA